MKSKPPQKSVKRVVFKTKTIGKSLKPAAYDQFVATVLSEEKQRAYLVALEYIKLRKKMITQQKVRCMMCIMEYYTDMDLKLHESKVHWDEGESTYYCLTEEGDRICSVLLETLINNNHTSRALIQHSMRNNVSIVHHSTSPFCRAYLVV